MKKRSTRNAVLTRRAIESESASVPVLMGFIEFADDIKSNDGFPGLPAGRGEDSFPDNEHTQEAFMRGKDNGTLTPK
jgi:hypothetical protein